MKRPEGAVPGLASAGIQMVTNRQTIAFIGRSVSYTSIFITCFLAALDLAIIRLGRDHPRNFPVPC